MKTTINIIWPLINAIFLGYVIYHLGSGLDKLGRFVYALAMFSITSNLLVKYVFKPAKHKI